ncbi:MAG: NAD(P)H-dependent flavin oxidoreductase [Aeromicrobium sp.]
MRTIEQLLGIEAPLIQAPMAGSQDSRLAIAVADAGGLGSLPTALMSPETLQTQVAAIRAATSAPFNLNFFCHEPPAPDAPREEAWRAQLAPYYRELGVDPSTIPEAPVRAPFTHDIADLLDRDPPRVVSFHFGLPAPDLLARVKRWRAVVLSSATTFEEGQWLEANGADVVIAQGLEAGGHRGMFLTTDVTTQVGTFALVERLAGTLAVPVIAAGGISTPKGVRAATALGAAGVQTGTVYLLSTEAMTAPLHRAALASPGVGNTAVTHLFTGRPARSIVNRLMRELGAMGAEPPAFPLAGGAIMPLRTTAEDRGSSDFSPLWAGQNAAACRESTAGEITRDLCAGF